MKGPINSKEKNARLLVNLTKSFQQSIQRHLSEFVARRRLVMIIL